MPEPRILAPRLRPATRLRLHAERRIDGIAYRLIVRQHFRAAVWLWRACRMW